MTMRSDLWPAPGERALCAVSGGLDSMCLLHMLICRCGAENVVAAHFNHQLRGENSDRDETFVRDWCATHDVLCVCGSGDVRALAAEEGLSVEEAARKARYAFLRHAAKQEGCGVILTAHHADDNAETMLLNLVRGTGIKGLCGIPPERDGVLRPLLRLTRAELADYATIHGLPHVEDETNADPEAAARNLLRLRVLPLLRELNPRAVENMSRAAEVLSGEAALLESLTADLTAGAHRTEAGIVISCRTLADAPEVLAGRTVLELLAEVSGQRRDLTLTHARLVLELVRSGHGQAALPYGLVAEVRNGELWIFQRQNPPEELPISPGETVRFGGWRVTLTSEPAKGAYAFEVGGQLSVTGWRRSDRMWVPGSRGKRSLKRLCADFGLTPRQRDGLPVLRMGENPVAVPGIGLDMDYKPQKTALFVTFIKEVEE